MISLTDMIGLCGLTQDEVDAIAEHEHIPEVAAAALGAYLLHKEHGSEEGRLRESNTTAAIANDKNQSN